MSTEREGSVCSSQSWQGDKGMKTGKQQNLIYFFMHVVSNFHCFFFLTISKTLKLRRKKSKACFMTVPHIVLFFFHFLMGFIIQTT